MTRINIEIPDDLHERLHDVSDKRSVPIKYLVIKAIEREYGEDQPDGIDLSDEI